VSGNDKVWRFCADGMAHGEESVRETWRAVYGVMQAAKDLRQDISPGYVEAARLAIIAERERALDAALAKLDEEQP
jgi:hypothetical protein